MMHGWRSVLVPQTYVHYTTVRVPSRIESQEMAVEDHDHVQ